MKLRLPLVLLLCLPLLACPQARDVYPPADHSLYDVPYATGYNGDELLVLDIHYPSGARDLPVIVYIHGGGWVEGDKSQTDVWCKRISRQGYAVFNLNYRLAPAHPFPAAVNDCLGALAWIRHHAAEYGADATRLGVTGGSAGGHLTAMVSTAAANRYWRPTGFENESLTGLVKAQSPFFGVFDFNQPGLIAMTEYREKFMGGKPEEIPEIYRRASPVTYISKDVPPTLIFCGRLDPIYDQSALYYDALKKAGADAGFITYPFETHAFEGFWWSRASQDSFVKMIAFFDAHLKN